MKKNYKALNKRRNSTKNIREKKKKSEERKTLVRHTG